MLWFKKKMVFTKVCRFEARPTGDNTWKYCVFDTLRDMEVPDSRNIYETLTQRDVDYYNAMEVDGYIFPWEEKELSPFNGAA